MLLQFTRCNGQGIRPGRPSLTPRPDMFPCHLCGRKLATKEAHDVHVARCDGVNNNTRGRKPADNTCMVSESVNMLSERAVCINHTKVYLATIKCWGLVASPYRTKF